MHQGRPRHTRTDCRLAERVHALSCIRGDRFREAARGIGPSYSAGRVNEYTFPIVPQARQRAVSSW